MHVLEVCQENKVSFKNKENIASGWHAKIVCW